jgi:hypothetical protein
MKSSRPPGEKGQDIIEYALLLSIIASLGFFIYSQHSMASSIYSVFNQAESLIETGARRSSPDYKPFLDSISSSIGNGTLHLDDKEHILSGTAEGDALAQRLGIPCGEGDAWSIGREKTSGGDYYVLVMYSAAKNDNSPISKRKTDWELYGPGNSKVARRGSMPVVPVTKYSFKSSTGEEDDSYANSGYVYGRGTEARVARGPEGRNTVF